MEVGFDLLKIQTSRQKDIVDLTSMDDPRRLTLTQKLKFDVLET